jgi:hypothetical protein
MTGVAGTGPGAGRITRAVGGALATVLLLAACTADGPGTSRGAGSAAPQMGSSDPVALEQVEPSDTEDVPSALEDPTDPALPAPLVDPARLVSGGPPPDGIPAIDEPTFERASSVTWLTDDEPVLSLEVDGEARAYPVRIMIWHEIVNDTVAGIPVAVTYCPLCNSALTFDRRAAGLVLSFGTSGLLYNSDLVMYDRQTSSLWPQLEGRAVAGALTGTALDTIPVQTVAWADFRAAHARAWVLSQSTGFLRNYGENPYVGYDEVGTDPFLFDGEVPDRLPAKARVVGLGGATDPVAVPLDRLAQAQVLVEEVAGRPVVLLWNPGLRSALDARELQDSRAVGAVGVFEPRWNGTALTLRPRGEGRFVDDETGSTWDVLGRAIDGPAAGASLAAVEHVDTFWFAWAAFRPETRLAG